MVSIIGAPPPLGISGPGGISTTRVIFLYHETSPPAGTENVQVSEKLPVPCVILHWECFQDTAAAGIINWTMSLYVSNNDSLSTNAAALGTRITSHRDAGSSPPDIDVARAGDLAFPFVGSYVNPPPTSRPWVGKSQPRIWLLRTSSLLDSSNQEHRAQARG
jgi:hypothetical protein